MTSISEFLVVLSYAGQIVFLWLLADFITGAIHWWEDTYGNPTWPIIGKYVIMPNIEHHIKPRGLLQGTYFDRVNTSFATAVIVIMILWLCGWHSWRMIVCLMFCVQGNEIHAMGHRSDKENGKIVLFLQKIGLIQRRKTHGWHHKAPYETNFCVMTEFVNPVLNKINFWMRLEWVILKVFRIKVLRGNTIRKGI